MDVRIPECQKKPGVFYAVTDEGVELPVIDITHPAFASDLRPEDLPVLIERSMRGLRASRRIPRFVTLLMARRSIIIRETVRARGSVLSGMATYLYKLGPENLGCGYASDLDRKLNRAIGPVAARERHREIAGLIAEAAREALAAREARGVLAARDARAAQAAPAALAASPGGAVPVRLINIAGGAAIDSINALILLQKEHPGLLAGRPVRIDVLDPDVAGPSFGARALAAVSVPGAPLAGIDATFRPIPYDWSDAARLASALAGLEPVEAVVCSSEGGLFEYGADEDVLANLEALRASVPRDCRLIGSAVRPCEVVRLMIELSRMPLRPRDLDDLCTLVVQAGWTIERSIEGNPLYQVVVLRMT